MTDTPGRDELREQIVRVMHVGGIGWERAEQMLGTWVAEHTAEIEAAALNAAADACHSGGFNGGRFEGHEYPHEWLRARARAALDPPTEGQK